MGMSDKQFDAYKKRVLREMERAAKEVEAEGKSETLKQLIEDLKSEPEKP
jgi:hypothetical protein